MSASLVKVTRKIVQMCIPQQYVVDGEAKDDPPTTWQYVKYFLGLSTIESKDKPGGEAFPILVYSGFENLAKTSVSLGRFKLQGPGRNIYAPKLYVYGRDPIPEVKLYSNRNIEFYSRGGEGDPNAVVIYDPRNKNPITQVPRVEQDTLIHTLRVRVVHY